MKNRKIRYLSMPKTTTIPGIETRPMGLQELTNDLLNEVLPGAVTNRSFFINEIPARLPVITDPRRLSGLLGRLLAVVVRHTKDSCIRLRTKVYGNVILMHMEEVISDLAAVEKDLKELQPAAEHLMSSVTVNSWRKNRVIVTFGFTNLPLLD